MWQFFDVAEDKRGTILKKQKHIFDKKNIREEQVLFLAGVICVCVVLLLYISIKPKIGAHSETVTSASPHPSAKVTAQSLAETASPQSAGTSAPKQTDSTDKIYSYLQGPRSWERGLDWSGEWGERFMDGGSFGGFGCGLCCLANIYSTETEYQCSPIDMYRYAKKHTGYSGGMAIGWGYMRRTLASLGFECHVEQKPQDYEEFVKDISESICSIVLVSSSDSKVYWKDTAGHYVTVFAYDSARDKIFLADSGNPEHNRQWVSLKKIYRSLKTASAWQYLVVEQYNASQDTWKHKSTTGAWNRPAYLTTG